MATLKNNDKYYITVGKTNYVFNGRKYIYDAVAKAGGCKKFSESKSKSDNNTYSRDWTKYAVRLVAVCNVSNVGGAGDSTDSDRNSVRLEFYCDPSGVETVFDKLPGAKIDRSRGLGSLNVETVYRPRRVSYR